jgi:hypothetical protein
MTFYIKNISRSFLTIPLGTGMSLGAGQFLTVDELNPAVSMMKRRGLIEIVPMDIIEEVEDVNDTNEDLEEEY